MPCPFIQVSFGNILNTEIETIRDNAFQYKYFNGYPDVCIAAEDRDFINNTKSAISYHSVVSSTFQIIFFGFFRSTLLIDTSDSLADPRLYQFSDVISLWTIIIKSYLINHKYTSTR
jgi:hypothetical protein